MTKVLILLIRICILTANFKFKLNYHAKILHTEKWVFHNIAPPPKFTLLDVQGSSLDQTKLRKFKVKTRQKLFF